MINSYKDGMHIGKTKKKKQLQICFQEHKGALVNSNLYICTLRVKL